MYLHIIFNRWLAEFLPSTINSIMFHKLNQKGYSWKDSNTVDWSKICLETWLASYYEGILDSSSSKSLPSKHQLDIYTHILWKDVKNNISLSLSVWLSVSHPDQLITHHLSSFTNLDVPENVEPKMEQDSHHRWVVGVWGTNHNIHSNKRFCLVKRMHISYTIHVWFLF